MLVSLPPRSKSRPADLVSDVISKLRAEERAATSEEAKARLLFEIGVLEEATGDDARAVADMLAAVNLAPDLREPLERLIVMVEKRRSFGNLGKLIARLDRVASEPEEVQRALLAKAAFALDHETDLALAREALERAVEAQPQNNTAWLMLELLAVRLGDPALRFRALRARAEGTRDPVWRALLFTDLARLGAQHSDPNRSIGALKLAIAEKSTVAFGALRALQRGFFESGHVDDYASALEREARLIASALDDPASGAVVGVPVRLASKLGLADAALRGALVHLKRGDAARAAALIDAARERLPDDATLNSARISIADAAGDTGTAASLAREELAHGVTGEAAAALWLRVAEAHMNDGAVEDALDALEQALAQDSEAVVARSLHLDLLGLGGTPERLARAWDATAALAGTNAAKIRCLLCSAEIWARAAGNPGEAEQRLLQAAQLGASKKTLARVARLFALVTNDSSWQLRTTAALAEVSGEERASLWLELTRAHLLAGDFKSAEAALGRLANEPAHAWLAVVLKAYSLPIPRPGTPDEQIARSLAPLEELARADTTEVGRALRLVCARRAHSCGARSLALKILKDLHRENPDDALVAAYLGGLLRSDGDLAGAAQVLGGISDETMAIALKLESALSRWLKADRRHAVEDLERVSRSNPEFPRAVLAWCRCAERPNDPRARREALDLLRASWPEAGLYDLESFALEARPGGDAPEAAAALGRIAGSEDAGIAGAAALARALWVPEQSEVPADRFAALQALAAHGDTPRKIALASGYLQSLADGEPPDALEHSARLWAETDASLGAACEWLAAALRARNPRAEIEARARLGMLLPTAERLPLEVSARITALLLGDEDLPFFNADTPLGRLTNAELAAPGDEPERRAKALSGLGFALDDRDQAVHDALLGYNLVAAGHFERAEACFRRAVEIEPEDVVGWEGLRTVAEVTLNRELMVEALAALGDTSALPRRAAELWEEAGIILLDELGDDEHGLLALGRAAEKDIRHFSSFDRLFRGVLDSGDGEWIVALADLRLTVAGDTSERVELLWEKAKAQRSLGDHSGTLATLDELLRLDPAHMDALTLAGEVHLSQGNDREAVERLVLLSEHERASAEQRVLSAIAAVDVLENKLNQPVRALAVLSRVSTATFVTLPVRERIARLAAKTEDWDRAALAFSDLMTARTDVAGRIEAARLVLAIYRDRLHEPANAANAVEVLLAEAPEDGEGLDLLLTGALDRTMTLRLLADGRTALLATLRANPDDVEQILRLATLAEALEDWPLKQVALGAALGLGHGSLDIERQLDALDQRLALAPRMVLAPTTLREIGDPLDSGPIAQLFELLGPTLSSALGADLDALGVNKKQRMKSAIAIPVGKAALAWAGALGIGEIDFYVGGADRARIQAVAAEPPALVLGEDVQAPFTPKDRAALAGELFALRRGTSVLKHRDPSEAEAIVVAACRVGGASLEAPAYAMLAEFERRIGKALPRKLRKPLQLLAAEIARSGQAPLDWVLAALSSMDRMAAIATGDVSWVLARLAAVPRGQAPGTPFSAQRARRLLSFVFSQQFQEIRTRLGTEAR